MIVFIDAMKSECILMDPVSLYVMLVIRLVSMRIICSLSTKSKDRDDDAVVISIHTLYISDKAI